MRLLSETILQNSSLYTYNVSDIRIGVARAKYFDDNIVVASMGSAHERRVATLNKQARREEVMTCLTQHQPCSTTSIGDASSVTNLHKGFEKLHVCRVAHKLPYNLIKGWYMSNSPEPLCQQQSRQQSGHKRTFHSTWLGVKNGQLHTPLFTSNVWFLEKLWRTIFWKSAFLSAN